MEPLRERRFDQKNEIFKRLRWDSGLQERLSRAAAKSGKESGRPGYSRIDQALSEASWALEDYYGKSCTSGNFGLYGWEAPDGWKERVPEAPPAYIPESERGALIKRAARLFGADLVGISGVDGSELYASEFNLKTLTSSPVSLPDNCETAIVMAVEMDRAFIGSSPDAAAGAATGAGYSKMAFISFQLAQFIRSLGYSAVPCGNDTALSIPLAIRAGLGEAGRNGLLITREFGPRARLFKIFTDLKIPPDPPAPFGVEAFCGVCRLCVSGCPGKAIGGGEKTETGPDPLSNFGGKRRWFIHPERCFTFWRRSGSDCSNCIRTCPFSYLDGVERRLKLFLIRSVPILNPLLTRLEKRGGKFRRKPLSGQ